MIQDITYIHSDLGNAKVDNDQENEAKKWINLRLNLDKKCCWTHFKCKLHIILDRDYKLISGSKTTTSSRHDSRIDSSKK